MPRAGLLFDCIIWFIIKQLRFCLTQVSETIPKQPGNCKASKWSESRQAERYSLDSSPPSHRRILRHHFPVTIHSKSPSPCRWDSISRSAGAFQVALVVINIQVAFAPKMKNAPPESARESVVCRKGHYEDFGRFLRQRKIQLMRMAIIILFYPKERTTGICCVS